MSYSKVAFPIGLTVLLAACEASTIEFDKGQQGVRRLETGLPLDSTSLGILDVSVGHAYAQFAGAATHSGFLGMVIMEAPVEGVLSDTFHDFMVLIDDASLKVAAVSASRVFLTMADCQTHWEGTIAAVRSRIPMASESNGPTYLRASSGPLTVQVACRYGSKDRHPKLTLLIEDVAMRDAGYERATKTRRPADRKPREPKALIAPRSIEVGSATLGMLDLSIGQSYPQFAGATTELPYEGMNVVDAPAVGALSTTFHDFSVQVDEVTKQIMRVSAQRTFPTMEACKQHWGDAVSAVRHKYFPVDSESRNGQSSFEAYSGPITINVYCAYGSGSLHPTLRFSIFNKALGLAASERASKKPRP